MTNMDRGQAASASSRRSSPIRVPWTLIGIASAASGVAIALVAFQGVRATTGVSAATALDGTRYTDL